MVRPIKCRNVREKPNCNYFKPNKVRITDLEIVILNVDEYEALKLKDYDNFEQIEASIKMDISQPTFNRLYNEAKKKVIKAIVEGLAIKIEGGNYKMPNKDGTGPKGQGPNTGRGLGNCEGQKLNNEDCNRPRRNNCQGGRRPCRNNN